MAGQSVVLVATPGQLHAMGATCSHYGASLDQGSVERDCLVCPWHGSRFRLSDGSVARGLATAAPQLSYDVRIQDDRASSESGPETTTSPGSRFDGGGVTRSRLVVGRCSSGALRAVRCVVPGSELAPWFAARVTPGSAGGEDVGRRSEVGENRVPPAVAVTVAIVVYALLPSSLLFTNRLITPIAEVLLLVALLMTNPRQMTRETRWSRLASSALAGVVILTNFASLGLLISNLNGNGASGRHLLVGALQIWVTNVIGFGLLFWEMDRGGPVARRRKERTKMPSADWRFSQDENDDAVIEVSRTSSQTGGWVPNFVDYLYVSLTNSSAFSPTDTMPLTSRAKILMGLQASTALLVSLVVVSFAVGALGN